MVLTLERTSRIVRLANFTLNVIGFGAITTAVIGLSVPTLHRDKTDYWHIIKNWGAIGLIGCSGVCMVWVSKELERLKPEIDAIDKAETMQGKHSIASWLFQANKLSSDIAQSVITDNSPVQQRQLAEQLEQAYQAGLQEGYQEGLEVTGNGNQAVSGNSETAITPVNSDNYNYISQLSPELIELIQTELIDGKSETTIIKDTMGMRGKNYKKGRQILDEIKRLMETGNE